MPSARRPRVRLLFDEDASPKVARALRELDFHVEHVGGVGQPPKGSTDEEILEHAFRSNQTVVTRNLDMVMLCAERDVSVVWLDRHRGVKELTLDQQAALAFAGIVQWCADLESASDAVCIRVLATRRHLLPVAEAGQLAGRRHHKIQQRKNQRRPKATPPGQMTSDEAHD